MKLFRREVLLVFGSVLLVLLSLFIPNRVDNRVELSENKLGFPVHFVVQDSSDLSIGELDSPPFPYHLGLISIWNYSNQFLRSNFLLSIVITYIVLHLLLRLKSHLPRLLKSSLGR